MRRRYHPPVDRKEAQRQADYYSSPEPVDVDSFFRCKHGTDLCERRCEQCEQEVQERLKINFKEKE